MPRVRDSSTAAARVYNRGQRGVPRYWADFRDYADVGGRQEALVPDGVSLATTDPGEAVRLAAARLAHYQRVRADLPTGPAAERRLDAFASEHLIEKAREEEADPRWIEKAEHHLRVAIKFFGPETDISLITPLRVRKYRNYLRELDNGRGGKLSRQSVTHYLNSLSNLLERGIALELLPLGTNAVRAWTGRGRRRRAGRRKQKAHRRLEFLEIHEAYEILEWARTYEPPRDDLALPNRYEILATLAYTGGRWSEIVGLERVDVNLDRRVIHIRINPSRESLKSEAATRDVPIPSELHGILSAYVAGPHAPTGKLFFPRWEDGQEQLVTDLRKYFDQAPMPKRLRQTRTTAELDRLEVERLHKLARLERQLAGERLTGRRVVESLEELQTPTAPECRMRLRSKLLRHSWCAARLQTLDHGQPISHYTVMTEMGHENLKLIARIYGHLGTFRYRGEEVSYRPLPQANTKDVAA